MNPRMVGKITHADLRIWDGRFGVQITLSGEGWATNVFIAPADLVRVMTLMTNAKVTHLQKLVGKPVAVTWDGNHLEDFRILTEVL